MNKKAIQELAVKLEVTAEQLAADMHRLCTWIREQGNMGYDQARFKMTELPAYFLEEKAVWDGILFHSAGERRRDYDGWGVRKNPTIRGEIYAWEVKWLERFGWLDNDLTKQVKAKIEAVKNPDIKEGDWAEYEGEVYKVHDIDSYGYYWLHSIYGHGVIHAKRHEIEPAKAPHRKRDRYTSGCFSEFTTHEIAYRAACAEVLCKWYARYHGAEFWQGSHFDEAAWFWKERYQHLIDELIYRMHAEPPVESSKKKTKAAAEDWTKAAVYRQNPVEHFFSKEFVETVTQSPEYPDLSVDREHLPKLLPEKTPVKWKTDREIFADLVAWLNAEIDPNSFEYDDRKTFIDMARRWLSTAKGEKAEKEIS